MTSMNYSGGSEAPKSASKAAFKKASKAFYNAKQRCNNPIDPYYPKYGGAGVKLLFKTPADLIAEIGLPKSKGMSLDRIDPHGHYEPGNVRWTNNSVQAANKKLSPGGSVPSLAQQIYKVKLKSEQPAIRHKAMESWVVMIEVLNGGVLSGSRAKWIAEFADAVGMLDWSFDISDAREFNEGPGVFCLPSLTIPGRAISLRGGPIISRITDDLSLMDIAVRQRMSSLGLIWWLGERELLLNVPKIIRDWMRPDLNSTEHFGAFWHGLPPPGAERSGWVDGVMLSIASYLGQRSVAAFMPLPMVLDALMERQWKSQMAASPHLCTTIPNLFIPDFHVDHVDGWNPTYEQWSRLERLLEYRIEHGRRTFVGIQNPKKIPQRLMELIMLHLRRRTIPIGAMSPHPSADSLPKLSCPRFYLNGGWDLTRMRENQMGWSLFAKTD